MNFETFQLADIDFTTLKLTKENVFWDGNRDDSRWMFRSTRRSRVADQRDLYFKVWNPTFIRRDNILTGIDIGFYDELTTLEMVEEFYRLIKQRSARTGYFHC